VYAAKRSRTDVVLLSVTNPQDRTLRQEQLRSIRRGLPKEKELWVGVNPPNSRFDVGNIRILGDFGELEREIQRIGGRFLDKKCAAN
jgi:hypothetical protein